MGDGVCGSGPVLPGIRSPRAAGAAPECAAQHGRFRTGDIVYEPERDRVGRVESAHAPAPVLYRIALPEGGPHGFAYDDDLRPASPEEIAEYESKKRRRRDHGPTR